MRARASSFSLITLGILAVLYPPDAAATCKSVTILHGVSSSFEQCGQNAHAFFWLQGRAIQRMIGTIAGGTAGHDSGRNQTDVEGMYLAGPNGNGSYTGNSDWSNPGVDGCALAFTEADTSGCQGGDNFGVTNYVLAGIDSAQPNLARMAVLSVDFNEPMQLWVLDNAGAPSVDGDPCGGDALSWNTSPVDCEPIPMPTLEASSATPEGTILRLGIGSTAGIPILDDCLIAEDRATNCPRNLYAGRALVYRHGACTAATDATLDHRSYIYPSSPPSGTLAVTPSWLSFSLEDTNLNGSLDVGEDGTHGGIINGQLDPVIIPGTDPVTVDVLIPANPDATDCIFLGLGILLDEHHFSLDPPTDTLFGETVMSPEVSVNPNPVALYGPVTMPDVVTAISARRDAGTGLIEWSTAAEVNTIGFNVIGVKNNGRSMRLNAELVAANEGTTGKGSTYTVTIEARELKGSSSFFIELVKTDGTTRRFGPARF